MRQPSPPDRRRRAAKKPARGAIHALLLLSGLLAGIGATPAAFAEDMPPASAPARDPYASIVTEAAQRFGIPEAWIRAVASIESGGDPRAVSPAGAMGLMQIMPDTWAGLRRRYGLGANLMQSLRPDMRVPAKHFPVFVTSHQRNLFDGEARFE